MHRTGITLIGMVVVGFMLAGTANAQQGDASDAQELKKDIAELKAEIAALKTEVKGLRTAITQAVAAMRSAAKPAAKKQRPAMALVGKKAPQFSLTNVDGGKHTIGGTKAKPQVVFCYASWCGYCKKSLPWIETLHTKYKDQGVEVLALNLDARGEGARGAKTEEQSLEHFKGLNLTMPMTMNTGTNNTKAVGTALKAQSFPTLFVVGASGNVESVHVGAKAGLADIVGKELDLLLAGKTRADFPK